MKNLNLTDLNIKITKSARSKNLRLRVDKSGDVHLSMPKWTLKSTGLKFVQDNLEWIQTQLDHIKPPKRFENAMSIHVLGQSVIIC
ncbi:MAG: DUF45 domain-containing protein, partial [Alphaproteobacteria bacterium]|nr:DUF45 domain-containing protein [Alphaproteobacteria bacterium]